VVASAVVLALAALPLFSGCATQKPVEPALAPVPLPDLQQAGLRQQWQRQLQLEPGERLNHAWRVGTSVYLTSTMPRLFRIEARSGVLAFAVGLGAENFEIYKPIELPAADPKVGPREVLVATRGEVFVLDIRTGDVHRSTQPGISISCQPTLVGNDLCVGATGRFIALYQDRLVRHWNIVEDGDLFVSAPALVDSDLIVASQKGKLARISPDTGGWDWKDRQTNGRVVADLVADTRSVYVPALDQRVYAFTVERGFELWQTQLDGTLDQAAALAGTLVLVPARGRGLYALSKTAGEKKWFAEGVTSVLTVGEDRAWVGDASGNLKQLSLQSGDVLSSSQIPMAQFFVRNTDDDQIVLVNQTGAVGAFQPGR
jgi:outer membrane protein assembly factor BamB